MLLYHVSTDLRHAGAFTPRISDNSHMYDEDDTIPRICVASSIEGCLTAIPNGGFDLEDLLDHTDGTLALFVIDTEQLGIEPHFIVTPDIVHTVFGVQDALVTGEHWILTPFTLDDAACYTMTHLTFNLKAVTLPRGSEIGHICDLHYTATSRAYEKDLLNALT